MAQGHETRNKGMSEKGQGRYSCSRAMPGAPRKPTMCRLPPSTHDFIVSLQMVGAACASLPLFGIKPVIMRKGPCFLQFWLGITSPDDWESLLNPITGFSRNPRDVQAHP